MFPRLTALQPRLIVRKFDYNFQTASVRLKRSPGCELCLAVEKKRSPFRALVSLRRHGIIFPFVVSDADKDWEPPITAACQMSNLGDSSKISARSYGICNFHATIISVWTIQHM